MGNTGKIKVLAKEQNKVRENRLNINRYRAILSEPRLTIFRLKYPSYSL